MLDHSCAFRGAKQVEEIKKALPLMAHEQYQDMYANSGLVERKISEISVNSECSGAAEKVHGGAQGISAEGAWRMKGCASHTNKLL